MPTEIETLDTLLETTINRLIELGQIGNKLDIKQYICDNCKLEMSPLTVLKEIEIDTLLAVFHNHGPNIHLMKQSSQDVQDVTSDLSEDETHDIYKVTRIGEETDFDLVIYNRHGKIGIEVEFDAAPALSEEFVISIWDDLSGKFDFADALNSALARSGIDHFYAIDIDEFCELYLMELQGR